MLDRQHNAVAKESEHTRDCVRKRETLVDGTLSRQKLQRLYRYLAPAYDLLFGGPLEAGRRALAEEVRRLQPTRVLEVGVGTGLSLANYPTRSWVCGVDLSPTMLQHASKRMKRRDTSEVSLLLADAEHLPCVDASFDCVTLPYVLSVTPDPPTLLAELRRVCRPGGHILILNHFDGAGPWGWTERVFEPVARRLGFRSRLPMDSTLASERWSRVSIRSVNLFGLSRLVVLKTANS
jgi:phosphatidylethanolamine/phosphatidyl-N-methylethanolamine N-methyltransferase